MCFSLKMSTIMFVLGSLCTVIASKKLNNNIAIWVGYFTIMQAIHIAGYLTINDCDNIYNKMTSYINYSHICFQPMFFLIGYLGLMQFTGNINNESRIRMNFALYITFSLGVFLFIRMFNTPELVKTDSKEPTLRSKKTQTKKNSGCIWCGKACSFQGEKHINFSLPLLHPSYMTPSLFVHMFGFFIVPLFVSKFVAFCSTILALLTYIPSYIHNIPGSEAATIWCFTSIVQCIVIILLALFYKK